MRRIFVVIILLALAAGAAVFYYSKKQVDTSLLVLYGNVDVRQVDLGFRVSGRVDYMPYQEGDLVTVGKLMGTLDKQPYTDQVNQASASLDASKVSYQNAERLLQRRHALIQDGSVSLEDFENAQSSKDLYAANIKVAEAALGVSTTSLNDTELYSPSEGTILTRIREPGSVVQPSDPIYTLSLISPVWIRAFISEPNLGHIYPGMLAEVFTDSSVKAYPGHIGFISPVAEFTPKSVETTHLRTDLVYRLRIIVDNPDEGLRQGMPVTVKLRLKENASSAPSAEDAP
jgi:HlyD family secretion protein